MRRHKDPSRRQLKPKRHPKQKTTQAEDPHNPDSRHKHGGAAPVRWRCTRYVTLHPNRKGALPTDRVQRPNTQEQTRNWHTEPLTATPLHAHLGPTGGGMGTPPTPPPALRPTPAHSDTSYTLKCEEPDKPRGYGRERRTLRGNVHHAPPVRKVPAGPQGLAGLRADAPSKARGVDGERAGPTAPGTPATQPTETPAAQQQEHRGPSQRNTGGAAARTPGPSQRNTGGAAAATRVCERPGGESPPPGLYARITCR